MQKLRRNAESPSAFACHLSPTKYAFQPPFPTPSVLVSSSSPFSRSRGVSHSCRLDESYEKKSSESSLHGDLSASLSSIRGPQNRPLFRMDCPNEEVESSSVQSRESIHVIFEGSPPPSQSMEPPLAFPTEPLHELKGSGAVAIPPGQLTRSFADLMGKDSNYHSSEVARSAPMPVPQRPACSRKTEQEELDNPVPVKVDEGFVPPHVFLSRKSLQDPIRSDITSTSRGLSSLRIRNAVLEKVGYFDGYTELSQKPEINRRSAPVGHQTTHRVTGFGNYPSLY